MGKRYITAVARDCARLHGQHAQLCAQMAASPPCDITRYVVHFEAMLQRMWAVYSARGQQRVIHAENAGLLDPGRGRPQ